jgi:hypothetical protein
VPQQIEGLLYDLAIEIGISPESLKTSSITDKARFLYDKGDILKEFDFEYFAFIFPVVRNRIAHGKKIDNKINDLAFTLLFDLQTVTTFFNSTKFKYNKALSILELIHKDEKDISSLIQYVDLLGTKIDPFYKPKYSDKEIKELLRKEFKFEKIQKRVRRGTVLGVTIPAIAKKLIRMGINTEDCQLVMDNYKVNDIGQGPPVRIVKIVKP